MQNICHKPEGNGKLLILYIFLSDHWLKVKPFVKTPIFI